MKKGKITKKIFALLMSLAMVITMTPALALTAFAGTGSEPEGLPTAEVTPYDLTKELDRKELVDLDGFPIYDLDTGQISSNALYELQIPDCAYKFVADKDKATDYDSWYADYTVSFDKPVAKNSMGLVGYYADWKVGVGFLAPVEIPAGKEIPLLNNAMPNSGWTYEEIKTTVREFICGAFNLSPENNGTKMTVRLRIFKPEVFDSPAKISSLDGEMAEYKEGGNTYVIGEPIEYTLTENGAIPIDNTNYIVAGTANGKENAAASIPAGMYYVKDGVMTLADTDVSVTQKTAYFTTEDNAVAVIDDTKYATLAYAIAAVQNGETIEMLRDVNGAHGISVPSGKNFTVDFCGHSYSVEKPGAGSANTKTQAFQLLKGSDITFKNGTISCTTANKDCTWTSDAAEKGVAMIIQNYANLTLDNMTIDASNIAHNGNNVRYAVSNNNGTTTIKNSTIKTAANDFAFDSYYEGDKNYSAPTVNVEESTINGKVEATGGKINIKTGTTVNGQLRVGENKNGTTVENSVVTIENGATVNDVVAVFGQNTLNVSGAVNGYIATNGNAYNAGSVVNILDGAVITAKGTGVDVPVYIPNGTLNISGGTITGETAVYFKSTNLNITGGTFIATGEKKSYDYNGDGCNATGDALVIDSCNYPNGIINVSVSGGKFSSVNSDSVVAFTSHGGTPITKFISGGYFTSKPEAKYVVAGKVVIDTPDGTERSAGYLYTIGHIAQETEVQTDLTVENNEGSGKTDEEAKTLVEQTVTENTAVQNFTENDIDKAVNTSNKTVLDAIKAELKNDNAVKDDTTAKNNIEGLTESSFLDYVKVKTEAATVSSVTVTTEGTTTDTTVKKMTFDVKPMVETTVTDKYGNTVTATAVIPNEMIKNPIAFRLPVADNVPVGTVVKVYHHGNNIDYGQENLMGTYVVQEESGKKFVQLASSTFSYFTYELTETVISNINGLKFGTTIDLNDSIGINLYINKKAEDDIDINKCIVTSTFKGVDYKPTPTGNGNKYLVADCAAKEMFENVHIVVEYDEDENGGDDPVIIKEMNYSVYDYCDSWIKSNSTGATEKLKDVCRATLDYGCYAKTYFNYTEVVPVNSDYTANSVSTVSIDDQIAGKDCLCNGITAVRPSLELKSKTKLIFYLETNGEVNSSNYTYTFSGGDYTDPVNLTAKMDNGRIRVESEGIAAPKLGEKYTLNVTKNGTDSTMNVYYSPMAYAKSMITSSNSKLSNLVKSLYSYYQKAIAYFTQS